MAVKAGPAQIIELEFQDPLSKNVI